MCVLLEIKDQNITKKRYGEIKPYVELLKKDTFEERAKKSARRKG